MFGLTIGEGLRDFSRFWAGRLYRDTWQSITLAEGFLQLKLRTFF